MLPADVRTLKEQQNEALAKVEPDLDSAREFLVQVGTSSQGLQMEVGVLLARLKLQEEQKQTLYEELSDNGTVPTSTPVDYNTVTKGTPVLFQLPDGTWEDGEVVCKVPMGTSAKVSARAEGVFTLRNRGETNYLVSDDMDTATDRILVASPKLPDASTHPEYGPFNGVFHAIDKVRVFPDT